MKNIFISSLFLIMLTSCETEFSNTHVIKNTTKHKILVTGYDKTGASSVLNDSATMYTESISIDPYSEVKKIKRAGWHSESQSIFDSFEVDSLTIVFDNLKIITYGCSYPTGISCTGKYNLMNYEENFEKVKTGKSSGKDEYTYTYVLNESDFEAAQPMK